MNWKTKSFIKSNYLIENSSYMKEKILDILEKHYHGRNHIESRCADELLDLFNVETQTKQLVCDVCGSDDVIEAPHMGRNCNRCNPL